MAEHAAMSDGTVLRERTAGSLGLTGLPAVGDIVTTMEQVASLPIKTVLATDGGAVAKRHQWGQWQVTGCEQAISLSDAWLPARILDLPGDE